MSRRCFAALCLIAVSAFAWSDEDRLVTVLPGTLPLIISAPHGGTLQVPGVEERTGEKVQKKVGAKTNFSKAFDSEVDKMAFELADAIEKLLHARPYVVVAHFSRKFIDANRPASDAYESPLAKPVYDEYHRGIATARRKILSQYRYGLLIDLHGQGSKRDAIFRGTADLRTVAGLIKRVGPEPLLGENGLLGQFASHGAVMIPANDARTEPENPALNGGWIVRHYGSMNGGTFDALQFEFGAAYRKEDRSKTVENLASALSNFTQQYLMERVFPTDQ